MRKAVITSVMALAMGMALTACGGGHASQEATTGLDAESTTDGGSGSSKTV